MSHKAEFVDARPDAIFILTFIYYSWNALKSQEMMPPDWSKCRDFPRAYSHSIKQ